MANTYLLNKPARLKYYLGLDWKKGISQLAKNTGLTRQTLHNARQQVMFHQLFDGRTAPVSYKVAKAAMNGAGRLKREDFKRMCRAKGIRVEK